MFSTKEKTLTPAVRSQAGNATLIAAGTTFKGDISSSNDLRIDGTIVGNVQCAAKVIIGTGGLVEGNIEGDNAEVSGRVQGNITIKDLLQLKGACAVIGNIVAAKLLIEPTATFNGQCQMGAAATAAAQVVHMNENEKPLAKAK
jgi:cytoskeletal protein CcmA (bactofilin family)